MTLSLRDRRRRQTAREIQTAALTLSLKDGFGDVTTDAIAHAAGISARTFFNYYPNKRAAILGPPPLLDPEDCAWMATSDAPVVEDLTQAIQILVENSGPHRPTMLLIERMLEQMPDLLCTFRDTMDSIATILAGHLRTRLGPDFEAEADMLAHMATHALSNAVRCWAADPDMADDQITSMVRAQLRRTGALMAAG